MSLIRSTAALSLALFSAQGQPAPTNVPVNPDPTQVEAPANMSPAAAEVVRLATSGVGDEVVLAYIKNSQSAFSLTVDHVVYLKDLGLSPEVTSAMINHDAGLRSPTQQYAPAPATAPPPAPAANTPGATTAPPTVAAAPAPAYVTSPPEDVTYFYNDLSPYGSWVYLEGYGWCWQPSAVVLSPGWRPYVDGGHWVYSDAGWFWSSTYSWGWAPFHYGRWYAHPRCGWVWFPDRVWGPAWVTWRSGGDACGWAPLPPHATFDVNLGWRYNGVAVGANFGFGLGANAYAFVSFGNMCNRNLRPHCLPPARVQTVYHQTTIVNNYTVHNQTIVNHGIPVERVSSVSRTPVPRATVREVSAKAYHTPSRNSSVVYRHELPTPPRSSTMRAERVDPQHPTIQHNVATPARVQPPASPRNNAFTPATTPPRTPWQNPRVTTPPPNNTRSTAPAHLPPSSTPTVRQNAPSADTSARSRGGSEHNPQVYYPKGYYQSPAIRSQPQPQRPLTVPQGNDSGGGRKDH